MENEQAQPGWYPNPEDPSTDWYWDGQEWTEERPRQGAPPATAAQGFTGCAAMELVPVTTSELRGRARRWGKELTVMDGTGQIVVEAALGRAAKPAEAVVRTADGEWRYDRRKRTWTGEGPERMWGWRPLVVVDASGAVVATESEEGFVLADGETLAWAPPRIWSSYCGLGGDLWVAKGLRPRRRGFRAELSGAMLAREDRGLLTGVGSVLTHWAFTSGADVAGLGDLGLG